MKKAILALAVSESSPVLPKQEPEPSYDIIKPMKRFLDPVGGGYQQTFSNIDSSEEMLLWLAIIIGAVLIQLFFPPGTRTVSRKALMENLDHFWRNLSALVPFVGAINPKFLREYRCPTCRKLLAKGHLSRKEDVLEVKCRGCSTICLFEGEDAEIISKRSELLKEGAIPDTELSGTRNPI